MAPYDKKPASNLPLVIIGVIIIALLLVIAGLGVWFLMKHSQNAAKASDESTSKAPIELPEAKPSAKKTVATPPAVQAPAPVKAVPTPPPPKPANPQEAAKLLDASAKLFAAGKFADCRETCLKALELVNEDDPLWLKVAEQLGKVDITIFTTDARAPGKSLYHVKVGDSLLKIAIDNNTTMEAIRKSSGMAENDNIIRPGQTLCVYKGEWSIRVSKSRYRLYVYDNGRLFKVYPVAIGRQDRTPAGTFELGVKQRNPDWYNKGRKYAFGSPENILGTRWMALNPTGSTSKDLQGYGIHGTNEPANVGKPASNGCVRLRNDDVDELFAITPMKTPVEIVE